MKLIIELTQEDVNAHTLSLIEQLFKSTPTGATTVKSTTDDSRPKTTGSTTEKSTTANILADPYDIDNILPEPISTTKPKQDNAERLKEFAKKIESTLNEKERKSLEKFVNFYISKINDWKPDINIQNLWDKWISSERK